MTVYVPPPYPEDEKAPSQASIAAERIINLVIIDGASPSDPFLVPGLLLAAVSLVYSYIECNKEKAGPEYPAKGKQAIKELFEGYLKRIEE